MMNANTLQVNCYNAFGSLFLLMIGLSPQYWKVYDELTEKVIM